MFRTVIVSGRRTNVWTQGAGLPLVLVHGFPLDHSMWNAQLEALEPHARVIAVDLPGFGASDSIAGERSMAEFADDVAGVLDALGVDEPIVFCGLSMGGYVGFEFFRRHRARLRALVLCDTRAAADAPEAAENRRKMADIVLQRGSGIAVETMEPRLVCDATRRNRPEVVAALRSVMGATAPSSIAAAQLGMAVRGDSTELLATIDVPCLYVVGDQDVISTAEEMQEMASATPGAEYSLIRDSGHMAPMEQPEAFNAALLGFLASLH